MVGADEVFSERWGSEVDRLTVMSNSITKRESSCIFGSMMASLSYQSMAPRISVSDRVEIAIDE